MILGTGISVPVDPDLGAFMGGVGVGLAIVFVVVLLVGGVGIIRRMVGS